MKTLVLKLVPCCTSTKNKPSTEQTVQGLLVPVHFMTSYRVLVYFNVHVPKQGTR